MTLSLAAPAPQEGIRVGKYLTLGLIALLLALSLAVYAGLRQGLLLLIGLGFGATLEGLRFGFTGPWRQVILQGDTRGLRAQLLAIALTALISLPLLAQAPEELIGAAGPIGVSMILGAFLFGGAMQVVLGCGSGTLVNAGSGNLMGLWALPFFIAGSFLGTLHLPKWEQLGTHAPVVLSQAFGPVAATLCTVAVLLLLIGICWYRAAPHERALPPRLWWAAGLLAVFAGLNLLVAGQPWGVVYGLGLWGAKVVTWAGGDLSTFAFWGASGNAERLTSSLLLDVTSVTNLGLLLGAALAAYGKGTWSAPVTMLPRFWWIGAGAAGLMGYASRLAYGCNVGAFFSGIASGSLHGWVWLIAAFAGSWVGVRVRTRLLETPS